MLITCSSYYSKLHSRNSLMGKFWTNGRLLVFFNKPNIIFSSVVLSPEKRRDQIINFVSEKESHKIFLLAMATSEKRQSSMEVFLQSVLLIYQACYSLLIQNIRQHSTAHHFTLQYLNNLEKQLFSEQVMPYQRRDHGSRR